MKSLPPAAAAAEARCTGCRQTAAPAAKPAPKPEGPKPEPWESELVTRLRSQYGSGIKEASTYVGQKYLVVDSSIVYEILLRMRDDELFDYCVDITAVHYPKREAQFDIVYILYSFHSQRARAGQDADQGRRAPAHRGRHLGDGELAGARSLRHVRHRVRRTSRPEAHPAARRLEGPSRCARITPSCSRTRNGCRSTSASRVDNERHNDRTDYLDLDTKDETFLDATELVLNMGPQHPSTHGVLRVILKLDGEKVLGTECVIGYLHRGVEKIGENRTYAMFNPYVDRMDYVAAVSNGLGYCEAVEKLLSVEAPPRAQYIRVILTELCRIASHQVWLGTHALDIGAMTPLFYCFRDREEILKIFEKYCGARLTTHAFRIGGCLYEAYDGFEQDCKKFCDDFLPKLDEYEELLTTNRIWVERTKGVGILNPEDCIALGVTGPVLRASGVKWDLRKAQPYEAYKNFDFEIPTGLNGDTYDRYLVRIEEMRQSVRIIRQAVDGLPQGPIMAKVPKVIKPPVGEVYHSIEAPKGELGYFIVSDGSTQPYRVRVRPPSFVNLQALDKMVRGLLVADVVAVIGTLDIVLGEVDR